jgi:hypothetical protein
MASIFQNPNAGQLLGQAFQQGGVSPSEFTAAVKQQTQPGQMQQISQKVYNQPAQAQQQAQKQVTLMEFIRMLGGQQ